MYKILVFLSLLMLINNAVASSSEPKNYNQIGHNQVRLNETSVAEQSDLKKVGDAKFSVLFWDIYTSELWTDTGRFESYHQPLAFEITYLRDIDKKDLLARTVDQWQHLAIEKAMFQPYEKQLLAIWPDIVAGDKLMLTTINGVGEFFYNGKFIGKVEDSNFVELFLAIWLSPKTSQPDLRAHLLGLDKGEN